MILWCKAQQGKRVGRQGDTHQFCRTQAGPFSARETMAIMHKAKHLQATLITAFAAGQNGTEKAVDAFAQYATAAGTAQYLAEGLESRQQRIDPQQQRHGLLQTLVPGGLLGGILGAGGQGQDFLRG